ncbi:MAG: large repetitive protein [Pseudonocardiales bacterium]|nr:large repetitive protein [Pseudonocardiales bacterium]
MPQTGSKAKLAHGWGRSAAERNPATGVGLSRTVGRWAAAAVAVGVAASIMMLAPNASATAPVSQSRGKFLSGQIGGTSLDNIASIAGEIAQNYGDSPVIKANSLDVSALNNAVNLPLTGVLQLPGGNVMSLGAVRQYARALADGSARGASGAIDNSGGIAAGGQNGSAPSNATADLSGAGGPTAAQTLGNLKLSLGALSAVADQEKGVNGAQTGQYRIEDMRLDLTAPGLANLVNPLLTDLTTQLAGLGTQLNGSLGGVVTITGLDTLSNAVDGLTSVELANGAITAGLKTGSIHIDVAKLLQSLGLDLNNLPANTHLLPYLSQALATSLPTATSTLLSSLQTKLTNGTGQLGLKTLGADLNASQLGLASGVLDTLNTNLTQAITAAAGQLAGQVFLPLANQFSSMLDIIVNGQSTNGGTFTEQAVQLNLGSGAAGAQIVLASASVGPGTPTAATVASTTPAPTQAHPAGRSDIKIDAGRADAPGSSGPESWLAVGGVLLVVISAAGLLRLRLRSARLAR